MYQKFARALRNLHRGQRGISGLETAIILIAFVTVASVLAYSVLSAGIFSAERGKETVYKGLEQAQSTLEIKGSVLGLSDDNTSLDDLQFTLALTIPDQKVDSNALVFNYYDDDEHHEGLTTTLGISTGSTERGAVDFIESDEQFTCSIPLDTAGVNCTAYETFTIQIIPPTGASLTVRRTTPGNLLPVIDLQ